MFKQILSILLVTFFWSALSQGQKLDRSVIERVGGDFKISKIETVEQGFKIKFDSSAPSKISHVILVSDHIHSGIREGETVRISADLQRVDGSTGYASQVLLFVPSNQGKIPVWITARDSKLEISKEFLKMHAPTNDYLVLQRFTISDRPVYSTDPNFKNSEPKKSNFKQGPGPCKMRLESNGRGGKQVTVLFNLPFNEEDAKKHMKTLQSQLGTGGTLKDSTIEFRGDVRDRVENYFQKINVKIVRAGG